MGVCVCVVAWGGIWWFVAAAGVSRRVCVVSRCVGVAECGSCKVNKATSVFLKGVKCVKRVQGCVLGCLRGVYGWKGDSV